jgi:hypothetical protein
VAKIAGEAVRRVKELIEDGHERLREDHAAIDERLSLGLDFEHHNVKDTSQSPSRILPRDPGIFDIWRYKQALILKRFPISVRCRAADDSAGDEMNEAADEVKDVLEDWLANPRNRFKDTRRRYVGGALAAGAWGARLDYSPERKNAVIRPMDARSLILPDGIFDPHDPECEWAIVVDRVPTERVMRQRWRNAGKVTPDRGYDYPTNSDTGRLHPGQVDLTAGSGDASLIHPSARTTIAYCYYRESYKKKPKKMMDRVAPGDERMLCMSCGWLSQPQTQTPMPYPMAMPCPECGELAELTDQRLESQPAYPDGRLVICAPLNDQLADAFYDDAWPVQWPTFPIMWWTPYAYPHRMLPQSDVSIHKTGVLAANAIVRLTYEQALKSRPLLRIPRVGITNAKGKPYAFRPEDGDVLFDESKGPPGMVQLIQGQPLNTSLFALYDRLQGRFRESQGTSQLALDADKSRDIPVGTVKTMTETGNVPLDDHGASLYDAETPLMDCLAETLRFAYVPARQIRVAGPDGLDRSKTVSGLAMPRVQVQISAGASLDAVDMDKLNAYRALIGIPEGQPIPPTFMRGFAKFARIDPDVVRQIEQDQQAAREQSMNDENEVMGRAREIVTRRNAGPPGMVPGGRNGA